MKNEKSKLMKCRHIYFKKNQSLQNISLCTTLKSSHMRKQYLLVDSAMTAWTLENVVFLVKKYTNKNDNSLYSWIFCCIQTLCFRVRSER